MDDGSIFLNQQYFNYATGLSMTNDSKWERLFGFKRRLSEEELQQIHCDLAQAIQQITEDIILKLANEAKTVTKSKNLVMAGGVALNCVANGKLLKEKIFDKIWIQPAAGDAGGALGAAFAAEYLYSENQRIPSTKMDAMQGAFLGPRATELEVELVARSFKAVYEKF